MTTSNQNGQVLSVHEAVKHFPLRRTVLRGPRPRVHAVDGISVSLAAGRTLGVVGESGCGKSTLGRLVTGLESADSGQITIGEEQLPVGRASGTGIVQAVFQDPASALDPRMRVADSVAEALPGQPRAERETRIAEAFEAVGIAAELRARFPHELSGGQQQRVCIARAIVSRPRLILLDEAITSLDASLQAQTLALLARLQQNTGTAYVFISHDLRAVRRISHSVAVMYLGQIVEQAPAAVFEHGLLHPYSVALRSTEPRILDEDSGQEPVERIVLTGEPPSAVDPPRGCRFAPRCPLADDQCRANAPQLRETGSGHFVRCHKPGGLALVPRDRNTEPTATDVAS